MSKIIQNFVECQPSIGNIVIEDITFIDHFSRISPMQALFIYQVFAEILKEHFKVSGSS